MWFVYSWSPVRGWRVHHHPNGEPRADPYLSHMQMYRAPDHQFLVDMPDLMITITENPDDLEDQVIYISQKVN